MDECQNTYPQFKSEGVLLVQAKNGDKESQEGFLRFVFWDLNFGVPSMFPVMPLCVPQVLKRSPSCSQNSTTFHPTSFAQNFTSVTSQRDWLQEFLL
jgi:hypothetical protein